MTCTRTLLVLWLTYLIRGMFIGLNTVPPEEVDAVTPHAVVFATNQDLFESPFWTEIQTGRAYKTAASSVIYIVDSKSIYHFDESETDPDFDKKASFFNKPWLKTLLGKQKRDIQLVQVHYGPKCLRSVQDVPTSYCALSRLSLGGGLYAQDYSWVQLLTLKVGSHKTIGANIGLIGLGATVAAGNDDISLLMGNSGGITCTILPGQRVQVFSSFRYVHFPWAKLRLVMFSRDKRDLVPQSDWKQISSRLALDSRMVQSRVWQSRPFEKRSDQLSFPPVEEHMEEDPQSEPFTVSLQSLMKPTTRLRLQLMDGCEDSLFEQQTVDGISSMLHLKLRSIGAVFFDMSTMPEYYCVDSEEDLRCDQEEMSSSTFELALQGSLPTQEEMTDSEDEQQDPVLIKRGRARSSPGRSSRGRSGPFDDSYERDSDMRYEMPRRGGLRGRASLEFDCDESDDDYDDCDDYEDDSRDRQKENERYMQRRRQRQRARMEKQREQERIQKEIECEKERMRAQEERECEEKRREQERLREERECEEKLKAREREERLRQLKIEMDRQERECERERLRLVREQARLVRERARDARRRQRTSDRDCDYELGDDDCNELDMDYDDDDCTMSDGSNGSDDEDEYTVDYGSKGKPKLRGSKESRKGSAQAVNGLRESARKTFRALLFQGD